MFYLSSARIYLSLVVLCLFFSTSANAQANEQSKTQTKLKDNPETLKLPPLPQASANNAVASVEIDNQQYLFSFMGLYSGKGYQDVHNKAWKINVSANKPEWQSISPVPSTLDLKGRLASIAVGIDDSVYLFGGYTVAASHEEVSAPDVYRYHVPTDVYTKLEPMPVPVDDAVALVYRNRYVYLVSGWHNDGNVNLVQVYDSVKNEWFQASPFLGAPVFGHAGGIVDNQLMICDGVRVVPSRLKRRSFAQETACYRGEISPQNPSKINWHTWFHPTDIGRYRMAAAGDIYTGDIVFVGGSVNPYNFNGIGYNGEPSVPDANVWRYNVDSRRWSLFKTATPTMDHRGLLRVGKDWVTIGGMSFDQKVIADVTVHEFTPAND